jgi:3-oxoacyl-[acyl-carrier protein] reductase
LEEVLETVKFIEEVGGEATYVLADVGTRDGCRMLVSRAVEVYGRLDILVNNAGVGLLSSFESLNDGIIDKHISADFKSVIYCSQEAVPHMREGGVIVNVSSLAGMKPIPGLSIYSAMKAAIIQLTRSMAVELASKGIRVFGVAPGFVRTRMGLSYFKALGLDPDEWARRHTLTRRLVEPEEVAELVVALIRIPSITGETIVVDGGASIAPQQ